jgi:hypothetical protein
MMMTLATVVLLASCGRIGMIGSESGYDDDSRNVDGSDEPFPVEGDSLSAEDQPDSSGTIDDLDPVLEPVDDSMPSMPDPSEDVVVRDPGPFTVGAAAISNSRPGVDWSASTDADHYLLQHSTSADCSGGPEPIRTATTSWRSPNELPAGPRYFCVTAVGADGRQRPADNGPVEVEVRRGWVELARGQNGIQFRSLGCDFSGRHVLMVQQTRFRSYDPATNAWTDLSRAGGPPPDLGWYSQVWTGTELIVWSGLVPPNNYIAAGWAYSPELGTWRVIQGNGHPPATQGHVAVWTGTEMIIFGGTSTSNFQEARNEGRAYNPATDTWRVIASTGGPGALAYASAAWSGTEMLVYGGHAAPSNRVSDSIHAYNPATNTWRVIGRAGGARIGAASAFGDGLFFTFAGLSRNSLAADTFLDSSLLLEVESATLKLTDDNSRRPLVRFSHCITWTGQAFFVAAGAITGGTHLDTFLYYP